MSEHVLWGFHAGYVGPAGIIPIKLTSGSLGHCYREQQQREKQGGWTLATYPRGEVPEGLRRLCAAEHGVEWQDVHA